MKIFFIRHGQTDWNALEKIQGSYDSDLNEVGREQAISLANHVIENKIPFLKIYSSPQKRAFQTANILHEKTGIELDVINGFAELKFGEWEGLTWKEVKEKYPEEYAQWYQCRRYTKAPGGESYNDMLKRVINALKHIIEIEEKSVAIVTHSAVIMCIQCFLYEVPFEEMRKFKSHNTEIIEVEFEEVKNKIISCTE